MRNSNSSSSSSSSSNDFFLGIGTSFKAFRFIFDHKLGHFFIYPLVITFLLVLATKYGIDSTVNWLTDLIYESTDINPLSSSDWPNSWLDWGKFIGEKTIAILLWVMMYFVAHKIIKYVVLILMSPVMALLSERTEKILTGNIYPFDLMQLLKDVWRGMLLATRNIIVELGLLIVIWIANIFLTTIIPPISILTTPITLILGIVISAYFYGFSTIDYINERRKYNINKSYHFVRQNKSLAIGNGIVFWGLINIPILGTYIGTVFAPILCSAGAVIALHEKYNLTPVRRYLLLTKNEGKILLSELQ